MRHLCLRWITTVGSLLLVAVAGQAQQQMLAPTGLEGRASPAGWGEDASTLLAGATSASQASPGSVGERGGVLVGRITDRATGRGVMGAEVSLEGTPWRTEADTAGRYRLADVDAGVYTLAVRQPGYLPERQQVTMEEDREDTVDVALEPTAAELEALVATATGPRRRRDVGNAIATLHVDSLLRHTPFATLTDLLAYRVPGITAQITTGAPGDPSRVRLRGLRSVLRRNDPIVIVDGIRVYAAQSEARSGHLTNLDPAADNLGNPSRIYPFDVPAPSPLDQIDPNVIEKIEVSRGASASTLYGADAANGVIAITTKRGRQGPTRWSASFSQARTTIPGEYPAGYYRWGHDAGTGTPQLCTILTSACVQDSLVRFQALNDDAFTIFGSGWRTGVSLSASGGTPAITYSLTGTYSDETGPLTLPAIEVDRFRTVFNREPDDWMRRPHHFETWSVSSAIGATLGAAGTMTLSSRLARGEQQRSSLERQIATLMGTYADTVNGAYYRPSPTADYTIDTASSLFDNYYVRQDASTVTFTNALALEWRPRSWFSGRGDVGLDIVSRVDELLLPAGLVSTRDSNGSRVRASGRSLAASFNLQGDFRQPLGTSGYIFTTSVGTNLLATRTDDQVNSAIGLEPGTVALSGADLIYGTDNGVNTSVYGLWVEPRIHGARWALAAGLRLDGGSAYGAEGGGLGGLVALPKLNGSWVVSEEPWFPRGLGKAVSSLRLRGAYGQAQVQPGVTDRLRRYTSFFDGESSPGGPAVDLSQLTLTALGNTRVRPERSAELEGGLDADFGRWASLELTAYRATQVDALMPVRLPPSVMAGGTVLANVGKVRNTGLEVAVGITPVRLSSLTWSAQLQYSRNTNTLIALGNGVAPDSAAGLVEGYPLYSRWARPVAGYTDQNSDGVLQPGEVQIADGYTYVGQLLPKYTTSLFTDLVLFDGAVGVAAGFSYHDGATQVDRSAQTNWVLEQALGNASAPLGEQAVVVATTTKDDPTDYGLVRRIAMFRFNALSVTYRAPASVARLIRARRLSIAVQGANLGMHGTYDGRDPDVSRWTAGESVVDTGQLPRPRRWQVAVRLAY